MNNGPQYSPRIVAEGEVLLKDRLPTLVRVG